METYSLILSSANTQNLISTTTADGNTQTTPFLASFNINWTGILPTQYTQFECSFTLITTATNSVNTSPCFVTCNLAKVNNFDQSSGKSNIIGISKANVYQTATGVFFSNQVSTIQDNMPFNCCYPDSSNLTISYYPVVSGATLIKQNFVCVLTFTPIE